MTVIESTPDRFVEHLEYMEFVSTFKTHKLQCSRFSHWDREDSWFGETKNLQETYDFAVHGWDAGLALIDDDEIKLNVHGTVKTMNDIAGAVVDVGGYVSGRPDHMVTFVDEVNRNKPELTIYVDIAYSAYWNADRIMEYTLDIMRRVNQLQANYDVRIVATNVLYCRGKYGELFIDVKKLDEPFVINSIAFAFHPSFFRRMWHFYLNTREEIATGSGAGLCNKDKVCDAIQRYHQREYGSSPALILPSLQNDKGDLGNLSKYTKINFDDEIEPLKEYDEKS